MDGNSLTTIGQEFDVPIALAKKECMCTVHRTQILPLIADTAGARNVIYRLHEVLLVVGI